MIATRSHPRLTPLMVLAVTACVVSAGCACSRTVTTFPPDARPHGSGDSVDVVVMNATQSRCELDLTFVVTNGRDAPIIFTINHGTWSDLSVTAGGQQVVGTTSLADVTKVSIPAHAHGVLASAFLFDPPLMNGTAPWTARVRVLTSDTTAVMVDIPGPGLGIH